MSDKVSFKIDHIDSLGQGVSKVGEKITFIGKTLPGEEGIANTYREKSKIQFASVENLNKKSELRTVSKCPHFEACPSCHFLHTDYESEVKFKIESMKWQLKRWDNLPEIELIESFDRDGYRNRLQLHYDKKIKKLGFISAISKKIVEVSGCIIAVTEIREKLKALYDNSSWLKLVEKEKHTGHIELYFTKNEMRINVNKRYSAGGFSQVNSPMNDKLKEKIKNLCQDRKYSKVLDLFGGSGNLTDHMMGSEVLVVDSTEEKFIKTKEFQKYNQVNIYKKDAVTKITKLMGIEKSELDLLVLDPPRTGLKNLNEFTKKLKPKTIFYISCFLGTLVRDIELIKDDYDIGSVHLIDFFPSTYHFESMVVLQRREE